MNYSGAYPACDNVWRVRAGDEEPALVYTGEWFMLVSVSRDGNYWLGNTDEEGASIYTGACESRRGLIQKGPY